jgi:hypothetical protein
MLVSKNYFEEFCGVLADCGVTVSSQVASLELCGYVGENIQINLVDVSDNVCHSFELLGTSTPPYDAVLELLFLLGGREWHRVKEFRLTVPRSGFLEISFTKHLNAKDWRPDLIWPLLKQHSIVETRYVD